MASYIGKAKAMANRPGTATQRSMMSSKMGSRMKGGKSTMGPGAS